MTMKVLFCPFCGTKLGDGDLFCRNCGASLSQVQMSADEASQNERPDAGHGPSGAGPANGDARGKRKTVYEGDLHKCPNCGEVLPSFVVECPACGYEIRGASNSAAIQEFAKELASAGSRQEKIAIIRNFPIPNTKEDILDFMILASSNIEDNLEKDISAAWKSKIEQACQKARIVFQDEKEFMQFQDIYSQVREKLTAQKRKERAKVAENMLAELMPVLPNVFVVAGWLLSIFILLPLCNVDLDNAGTNGSQLLLMLDLVAGAIWLPHAFKCPSHLPKLIASLGLILSIAVLIPLCGKNLDDAGTNAYQLIMMVDIVCSAVIFIRMFKQEHKSEIPKAALNAVSFSIALICVIIMLAVYGVGSVRTAIMGNKGSAADEEEKQEALSVTYEWPTTGLSQYLPLPPTKYGEIDTDNESRFSMEVYQVSSEDFENYVKACKEKGFTIDVTKTDSIFYAYHAEQYDLDLFYTEDEGTMTIFLDAPLEMSEIKWPDNEMLSQIPQPESLIGNITSESSEHFSVHIANTTPEQYSAYVDRCIDAGFTEDYSRSDEMFYAFNKEGYYLDVEQELFDKIYISITAPEATDRHFLDY